MLEDQNSQSTTEKKRNNKSIVKDAKKSKKNVERSEVKFLGVINPNQGAGDVVAKVDAKDNEVPGASSVDEVFTHAFNKDKEHTEVLEKINHYKLDVSHVITQDKF